MPSCFHGANSSINSWRAMSSLAIGSSDATTAATPRCMGAWRWTLEEAPELLPRRMCMYMLLLRRWTLEEPPELLTHARSLLAMGSSDATAAACSEARRWTLEEAPELLPAAPLGSKTISLLALSGAQARKMADCGPPTSSRCAHTKCMGDQVDTLLPPSYQPVLFW